MERLGYALTWPTRCFIDGGCGQSGLFGHTNGYGDFVLLDSLGWPWPIHGCYARRFELGEVDGTVRLRGTAAVAATVAPRRQRDSIFEVTADLQLHKSGLDVIGTVTNIESGLISRVPAFRALGKRQREDINKTLGTRRSYMVVASGDGYEYGVLFDGNQTRIRFRDTVAVRLKPVRLLNQVVFVATKLVRFDFST